MAKGVFQTPLFVIVVLFTQFWRSKKSEEEEALAAAAIEGGEKAVSLEKQQGVQEQKLKQMKFIPKGLSNVLACVGYAVVGGIRYGSMFTAVLLVPVSDMAVVRSISIRSLHTTCSSYTD